ncbi:MAG: hypothetical protein ACYCS1_09525 [Gammaproteobacteria bacterium]
MNKKMGMHLLLVQTAVTLVVLAAFFGSWFTHREELPFVIRQGKYSGVIVARPDIPLPKGLRAGDRIPWVLQTSRVRALIEYPDVPSDQRWPLTVLRDGRAHTIQVQTQRTKSRSSRPWFSAFYQLAMLLALGLGLLTLWRGRTWAAWGISLFCLSVALQEPIRQFAAAPYCNLMLMTILIIIGNALPILGPYLTARSLTQLRRPVSAALDAGFGLILGVGTFSSTAGGLVLSMTTQAHLPVWLSFLGGRIMGFLIVFVPIGVLIWGIFRSGPDDRLRIRWILASTALLVPIVLLSALTSRTPINGSTSRTPTIQVVILWLFVVMLGLYAFAVLRQRLVDVRIALNRAIVFGLLMATVVGLFALAESLIERSAIGRDAGIALEIVLPLLLGILFHQLHRRIESLVDRLIFRNEHRSREVLRAFVRDAGFIGSLEVLTERIARAFGTHAGGQGAALYEPSGSGWQRTNAHGPSLFPDRVETDDSGVVRLRATLTPLDLHGMGSVLGSDGLALPLALRGGLFAILLIGPRPAGRYAQSEIERLEILAHEVGAALFALRARINQAELDTLEIRNALLEKLILGLGMQPPA